MERCFWCFLQWMFNCFKIVRDLRFFKMLKWKMNFHAIAFKIQITKTPLNLWTFTFISLLMLNRLNSQIFKEQSLFTKASQNQLIRLTIHVQHHYSFRILPPPNKYQHKRFPYQRLHNNKFALKEKRFPSQSEQNAAAIKSLQEFHWIRKLNYFSISHSLYSEAHSPRPKLSLLSKALENIPSSFQSFLNHYSLQ